MFVLPCNFPVIMYIWTIWEIFLGMHVQTQHKKASNHHANHTPGNVQFYIVTTWETPGNHWCWWPDTLIITLASARAIIKVSGHQHQWFPGGYNIKLYISRGMVSMVVTGFFAQWKYVLAVTPDANCRECIGTYITGFRIPALHVLAVRMLSQNLVIIHVVIVVITVKICW